ncbi:MAG: methyltransferase domain-containing protein [Candidatus Latescibacteria bacterium]|nr:methyltransferase domain-containing protein [Candidatus Latescibacterota bacterium]
MSLSADAARKERIARSFSRRATTYDQHAAAQRRAAESLLAELAKECGRLPAGPVLEIGCGTGSLSAGLVQLLPGRECWFTDLSTAALEICRQRLGAGSGVPHRHWQTMDGESGPARAGYALIASGMALHWFADWPGALRRWLRALRPGGLLAFSFQEAGSFPEWREECRRLGLPCTANTFPALEQVQEVLVAAGGMGRCWVATEAWRHDSAQAFFRSLKQTGTATSLTGGSLGAGAFRGLLRAWDQRCPEGVEVRVSCGFALVWREAAQEAGAAATT